MGLPRNIEMNGGNRTVYYNYDLDGFYVLHRINTLGKHQLIGDNESACFDPFAYSNAVQPATDRYRMAKSNYPWAGTMWDGALTKDKIPSIRHSRFLEAAGERTGHLVMVTSSQTITYKTKSTSNDNTIDLGRADSIDDLEDMLNRIIDESNRSVDSIGKRINGEVCTGTTNTVDCIIVYDDFSYDVKEVSVKHFFKLCGVDLPDNPRKHVAIPRKER